MASVLDDRRSIYSALVGREIVAPNETAKMAFRFCCALNPEISQAGSGNLPDYIDERTLPLITVSHMPLSELSQLLEENLSPPQEFLRSFEAWYQQESDRQLSTRQAITLVQYAMNLSAQFQFEAGDAMRRSSEHVPTSKKKAPVTEGSKSEEHDEQT